MNIYHHVVIAIDLHPGCDEAVIQRALAFAKENQAKVSLVHAIEHINAYGVAEAYSAVLDVEEEMVNDAKKEMARLGDKFGIAAANQFVEVGSPKAVVLDKVEELKADLIIVGSHGRHGLQLLLGSTANAVLHNAKCDVLAVRLKEDA